MGRGIPDDVPAHNVNDLRVRNTDRGDVVVCKYGWESDPKPMLRDATEQWQRHRDAV